MLLAEGFEIVGLYFYWLLLELEGLPLREDGFRYLLDESYSELAFPAASWPTFFLSFLLEFAMICEMTDPVAFDSGSTLCSSNLRFMIFGTGLDSFPVSSWRSGTGLLISTTDLAKLLWFLVCFGCSTDSPSFCSSYSYSWSFGFYIWLILALTEADGVFTKVSIMSSEASLILRNYIAAFSSCSLASYFSRSYIDDAPRPGLENSESFIICTNGSR